eukprot:scaffold15332_cov241-Alexandrium_tamarense.AAC.1
MNSKNSSISFYVTITIATTAVACLVLLPRETRAFAPTFQRRWNRHQTKPSSMTSSTTSTLSTDENQHESNGMPILPSDVVQYTQVPKVCTKFTATTIPSGLLKEHTTKKGTWGIIRVSKGQLQYSIVEPQQSTHTLDSTSLGVIEPTKLHSIKALSDDVEFVVEFWRRPGTGVVDEKREGL